MINPQQYLFSHLVTAHHAVKPDISVSDTWYELAKQDIKQSSQKHDSLNVLLDELDELEEYLSSAQSISDDMRARLFDKVGVLKKKIREKKEKLDL